VNLGELLPIKERPPSHSGEPNLTIRWSFSTIPVRADRGRAVNSAATSRV
jgi:hypothetical protein